MAGIRPGSPPPLKSLPLTVITAGQQQLPAWREMQAELAALSDDSTHIVADNAGHYVHLDAPEVVIKAVKDVARRAGDAGWYWHLAEAELRARGHQTIAPDLPCDNDTASLDDYAGTVADAASGAEDLVIVGQSYGAFTATLAASQLPARLLVLLAGMIPVPGESPG